ncbi:MAG: hypothetical protein R3192_07465 [Woeseiaceae bacterium]|nr:hypothetical protein [Woeseiaceae bacterium]
MTHDLKTPILWACAVAIMSAGPASPADDDGRYEMWEEPSHQLVFVEGPARVLDVRIVPGATSEFHKHRFATLYVIIQDALVANQVWETEWSASGPREYRRPGATADMSGYVEKPFYHRVRNEDDRTFHVVAVINERVASQLPSGSSAGDEIDNRWFREHRVGVAPGSRSRVFSFANDAVLVQYAAGSSHIVENGTRHGFKTAPGAFSWHPAGSEFVVVNSGDSDMEFVLTEIKK